MLLKDWGINSPDLLRWWNFLEVTDCESDVWDEDLEKWVEEDESQDELDRSVNVEMDALEKRARASLVLQKRPFDARERKIRKNNSDRPIWVNRMWFYISTVSEVQAAQTMKLEKDLHRQVLVKKRKTDRTKLFKRLGKRRR